MIEELKSLIFIFIKAINQWQHTASHPRSSPASHQTELPAKQHLTNRWKNKTTISRVLIKTEHSAISKKYGVIQGKGSSITVVDN